MGGPCVGVERPAGPLTGTPTRTVPLTQIGVWARRSSLQRETAMQSLTFNNTQFDIVDRNGNPWVRANQIGLALEYKNPELSIAKLYRSNAEEFSDKMTALIEMPTKGGVQQVRIFSLRGAHLLAMFARTKVAKEFRHWVLDVLEGVAEVPSPAKEKRAPKALPNGLSIDQQDAIKALVKARVEALPKEKQAKAAVTCWSALKSKFGCSYKKIESDQFAEAVGLVARIELEGEWLPKAKEDEFVLGFYEAQEVCHLVHHAIWCVYRWDSGIAAGVKAMNYPVWLSAFEHFQEASRSARRIERLMPELIGYFRQKNGGLLPEQCAAKGIVA